MPNNTFNALTINAEENVRKEIFKSIKDDDIGLGSIDFNKIIPMSPSLGIEKGSRTDFGIELYLTAVNPKIDYYGKETMDIKEYEALYKALEKEKLFGSYNGSLSEEEIHKEISSYLPKEHSNEDYDKKKEELILLGKAACDNMKEFGATTWYDWSVKNWGTKWKAYGYESMPNFDGNTLCFNTAWFPALTVIGKLSNMYPDTEFTYEWSDEELAASVGRISLKHGEVIRSYLPEPFSKGAYELACEIEGFSFSDRGLTYDEKIDHYVYENSEDMEL